MKPTYEDNSVTIYQGDVRKVLCELPDESVNCVVTSPPYWGLRDYGCEGQIGLESSPVKYISAMREVFAEVRRVLRSDGTLWLNMGDSYSGSWGNYHPNSPPGKHGQRLKETPRWNRPAYSSQEFLPPTANVPGLKPKDLVGIPWMLAFALREDGWYLRQDIIWAKPNPMPESVTDRCTKSHEYLFLLSKSERYYYDQDAVLEEVSPNTHARLSQDVQNQIGSDRVPGKTNGNMKAVARTPASYKGSVPGRNGGPGQDRRSGNERRPKAWDVDMGSNRTLVSGYGRKLAEPGSGIKNNSSFDEAMAIMPEKRNRRSVWEVTTQPFPEAHFATFPEDLIKPCILAGCPEGGTVLDPFMGSGTTGLVARKLNCKAIGIELNPDYIAIAARRLWQECLAFPTNSKQV